MTSMTLLEVAGYLMTQAELMEEGEKKAAAFRAAQHVVNECQRLNKMEATMALHDVPAVSLNSDLENQ